MTAATAATAIRDAGATGRGEAAFWSQARINPLSLARSLSRISGDYEAAEVEVNEAWRRHPWST